MTDVLIVGAGITGLCTAYWLTKAGKSVTIVEQGRVPNPTASSSDHHRLIRMFYGARSGYAARMPDAYAAWRAMWADLGPEQRYYAETGMLALCQEKGDYTDLSRAAMEARCSSLGSVGCTTSSGSAAAKKTACCPVPLATSRSVPRAGSTRRSTARSGSRFRSAAGA